MGGESGEGREGTLEYASRKAGMGLALSSMVLGMIGFVATFVLVGIPVAAAGLGVGIVALRRIRRSPDRYAGKGFAVVGVVVSLFAIVGVGPVMTGVVLHMRELDNRSACAANLRGIECAMIIYSAETDAYPVLPYAPYSPANAGTGIVMSGAATMETTRGLLYTPVGSPMNGSVLGGQWILILHGMSPKLFRCRSDPFATGTALLAAPGGTYYTNFQKDDQISYSFAYPYGLKLEAERPPVGWRDEGNASIPHAADMAPLNGTGRPKRNVSPGAAPRSNKIWNSGNHGGAGQNVVFGDGHAEWTTSPDVGQMNDNIYTLGGAGGGSRFGGTQPGKSAIVIETAAPPLDTVMVPVRNLDTGGL